jgi:hypothetical protein
LLLRFFTFSNKTKNFFLIFFIWAFILYDYPNKQEDYFPKKHKIYGFDNGNVDFELGSENLHILKGFPCSSSVERQMAGLYSKTEHGPHSSMFSCTALLYWLNCLVQLLNCVVQLLI